MMEFLTTATLILGIINLLLILYISCEAIKQLREKQEETKEENHGEEK